MVELVYEMTFAERIEGPLGPTTGFPSRLCWKIAEATLAGPRISCEPGHAWDRLATDRRQRHPAPGPANAVSSPTTGH